MNALTAREALDGQRRVDDAAGVLVLLIRLDEIRAVQVLFARLLLKHLLELDAGIARHHLGQALAHIDRVVEHARSVVDGLLCLDGRVRDDVGDLLGAVELANVLDYLEPSLIVEVHIDIGHLSSFGREEPLEHEAVR